MAMQLQINVEKKTGQGACKKKITPREVEEGEASGKKVSRPKQRVSINASPERADWLCADQNALQAWKASGNCPHPGNPNAKNCKFRSEITCCRQNSDRRQEKKTSVLRRGRQKKSPKTSSRFLGQRG